MNIKEGKIKIKTCVIRPSIFLLLLENNIRVPDVSSVLTPTRKPLAATFTASSNKLHIAFLTDHGRSGYLVSSTTLGSTFAHAISLIFITMIASKSLDHDNIMIRCHEDIDRSFNWFLGGFLKALAGNVSRDNISRFDVWLF
jgi:hypothetical protein